MYEEGRSVGQSDAEAVKWYRKSAEKGEAIAQYRLGWMYTKGRGMQKDNGWARHWFQKAAEQDYKLAKEALRELNG